MTLMVHTSRITAPVRAALICALLFSACDSPTGEAERPAISSIQPAATSVTLPRGSARSVLFSIARSGAFDGDVTLTAENLPAGVTASFGPPTLDKTAILSLLTVTALPSAQVGTYSIRARASGQQVESRTADMDVVVTVPGVDVSIPTDHVDIAQGDSKTLPVTVARTGAYNGPVTVAVSGLPAGVTASFDRVTIPAGESSSTLNLNASLVATTGSAEFSLRAFVQGVDPRVVPVTINVAPAATPSIVLQSAAIALLPGASGQATVSFGRSGNYEGPVTISLDGALPAGMTADITPQTTTGSSAVVSLTSTAQTPVGVYNVPIRASGPGIPDASATLLLTVLQAPGLRVFPIDPITVVQGKSAAGSFSSQRVGGYVEPFTITVEGLPTGLTTTLPGTNTSSAQVPSFRAFTVTAAQEMPTGEYDITVRVAGQGIPVQLTTLKVIVVSAD